MAPRSRGAAKGSIGRGRFTAFVAGGALVAVAAVGYAVTRVETGDHHPTPRDIDHAAHVMPASEFAAYPRVAATYERVAAVPHVVDGVYCYCRCSEHSGHHSLLDCFASDHGAHCDICLSEATLVYQMSRAGHDLDAIRAEIDRRFQS